jgi:thioredoxin reductase (NADPH)
MISSSSSPILDLLVVGAGPCGIAVGAAARKADLSCILVDQGPLCSAVVGYPYYMQFFSTPDKLELEGLPFVTAERNASRKEALAYYRKVTEYFRIPTRLYEEVLKVVAEEGGFRVHTRSADGGEHQLMARNVVVATGGFHEPNWLGVPGEDLPKVSHHYREAHPYWNRDVVVVGGSNSAVEAALELFRSGARVTLVHFKEALDRGVKPWILPDIQNRLEKREVEPRFGHRVVEIRPSEVVLRDEATGQLETLANDHVLALTGWRAEPRMLVELGVPVDGDTGVPAHDPETMETQVRGVFLAGVLAAGHDANRIFIENGRWHGGAIVRTLLARGL